MLHHDKIYHEFLEERETMKAVLHDLPSKNRYTPSNVSEMKVKSCGISDTRCQSWKIGDEGQTRSTFLHSGDIISSFPRLEYHFQGSSTAAIKSPHASVHMVTLSSPSTVLSCVENAPRDAQVTRITVADSNQGCSESSNGSLVSKALQHVHISGRLMEEFLELARDNTKKDLETCGVLGAFLILKADICSISPCIKEKGTFYVTTLIIPKQESTSSTCQAIREEEIFAIQNERSLFPLGWIHTHPSQSCFMSSVDLHTQYSYQVMVAEAFAIVMAPTDTSRSYGLFRLSEPVGMCILKECQEKGFHSHTEPADGSPLYEECSNVYINSNLRFEIFDLR